MGHSTAGEATSPLRCAEFSEAELKHGILLYKTLVFTLGDPLKE